MYLCGGSNMCVGWGYQQRFYRQLVFLRQSHSNRLIMTTPCVITDCVVPNKYQWIPIGMEVQSESKMIELRRCLSKTSCLQNKYLIYLWSGNNVYAGWKDRQLFYCQRVLAKVTGTELRLIMTTSCIITNCVVPNGYQWIAIGIEVESESKITLDVWRAAMVTKFTDTL